MSTSCIIAVYANSAYKLAYAARYDGYPTGQGIAILRFLNSHFDAARMRARLARAKILTREDCEADYVAAGATACDRETGYTPLDILKNFRAIKPTHDDTLGFKILEITQDADETWVTPAQIEHLAYHAMPWAYVIDLDHNTFEVYDGHNTRPLAVGERFHFLVDQPDREPGDPPPARILAKFALEQLPSDVDFLVACGCGGQEIVTVLGA